MTDIRPGAIALLAGAIRYALGACAALAPGEMSLPTPCTEWDLGTLLGHLSESMADLEEGLRTGRLDALPGPPAPGAGNPVEGLRDPVEGLRDRVEVLRDRAAELLCAAYGYGGPERFVAVGGLPVPAGLLTCAGAVEIAVHGWDVSQARGGGGPIPPRLAARLLCLCPLLAAGREGLLAVPVEVPPQASPGDRLVGYLGRQPRNTPARRGVVTGE